VDLDGANMAGAGSMEQIMFCRNFEIYYMSGFNQWAMLVKKKVMLARETEKEEVT